jgi:chitin disaccharide deacetylase
MKKLIVNADDLGSSIGINEGIIEAHQKGIVTSTSLLVLRDHASEGARMALKNKNLGLGLHFEVENDTLNKFQHLSAIPEELLVFLKKDFINQLNIFRILTGVNPTHVDFHKYEKVYPFIKEFSKESKIPYRHKIKSIDSFFGQPTEENISEKNLISILKNLKDETSELMCHPGKVTDDLKSFYAFEREKELKVLTSFEIIDEIKKQKIELINWAQL